MNAVQERFCKEYGLSHPEFGQLKRRINKAVNLQTRVHNEPDGGEALQELCDKATDNATAYARGFGITLRWDDGLYPSCVKGQHDRLLPME